MQVWSLFLRWKIETSDEMREKVLERLVLSWLWNVFTVVAAVVLVLYTIFRKQWWWWWEAPCSNWADPVSPVLGAWEVAGVLLASMWGWRTRRSMLSGREMGPNLSSFYLELWARQWRTLSLNWRGWMVIRFVYSEWRWCQSKFWQGRYHFSINK